MKAKALNIRDFDQLILESDTPVLVDFWAPWCGPCRQLGPIIDEIAEKTPDQAVVAKVNVDEASDLAVRYQIRSIPTLLVFRNGQVAERLQGVQPKDRITEALVA